MCEALFEFSEGWEGVGLRKNPFHGGGIGYFVELHIFNLKPRDHNVIFVP